jgi:hypothetical protein
MEDFVTAMFGPTRVRYQASMRMGWGQEASAFMARAHVRIIPSIPEKADTFKFGHILHTKQTQIYSLCRRKTLHGTTTFNTHACCLQNKVSRLSLQKDLGLTCTAR